MYRACATTIHTVLCGEHVWACCGVISPSIRMPCHPGNLIHYFFANLQCICSTESTNPYVILPIYFQRILEYFDSSIQEIFLEEIIEEVYYMAKDQYANYVVQVSQFVLPS